jgi:hypothetical protein
MPIASNWWVPTQPGPAFPGGATTGGGGFSQQTAGVVQYRSPLDAQRAAKGSMPHAEYPDGYLGTITNRREDKLLDAVQERLTERSYQRGVHKGEKIARTDYLWDTSVVDPMGRIRVEAQSRKTGGLTRVPRYVPTGNPVEKLAHLGKTAGLSAPEQQQVYKQFGVSIAKNPVVIQDPGVREHMQKMLPRYAM